MARNRILLALLVLPMFALSAAAQSDTEFGRASGGSIDAITKAPRQLSGSLSLSRSSLGHGYDGSVGGKLLDDRLWFFAAASILPNIQFSTPDLTAIDVKAAPVEQTLLSAVASPSSFLSLRSTSLLSERTVLSFTFSKSQ